MTVSEKIDKMIADNDGSVRDALNVAMARLENTQTQFTIALSDLKKERENVEFWKEQYEKLNENHLPFP